MRREERGAVAVLTAFVLVIILGVCALVVDLGMQRVARSDVQALADIAATDLARDLDGRTVSELRSVVDADAATSVARNPSVLGSGVPALHVALGRISSDGTFVEMTSGVPTAVRVTAGTTVAFAFAGITGHKSGAVSRSAIGVSSSSGCFRLGSFAAALRSGNSSVVNVFEHLVGSDNALAFNIGAIGYMGLIDSTIDLGQLATRLGAGTPDALVAEGRISVASVLNAGASVLNANGQSSAAATLGQIAARVRPDITADIGNILSIGGGQAVGSSINTIDLIGSSAVAAAVHGTIADQSNLLHTGVSWAAPHASNGDIALNVIEAPRQACGAPGTVSASTGQLVLGTGIGFNLPSKIAGLTVGSVEDPTKTQTTINVDVRLGGADGSLAGLSCAGGVYTIRTRVDSQLLHLELRMPFVANGLISPTGIVPDALIPALVKNTAKLQLNLKLTSSTVVETAPHVATADTVYSVPPHHWTDPEPSPGSSTSYVGLGMPTVSVDMSASTATLVTSIGNIALDVNQLNLSSIISAASASVIGTSLTDVATNLNQAIVPLADLLGMRFGGADVFGVPTPTCNQPRLAG